MDIMQQLGKNALVSDKQHSVHHSIQVNELSGIYQAPGIRK